MSASSAIAVVVERRKPKEKGKRIFISEEYENKIDDIAKKLEEFGNTLRAIQDRPQPCKPSTIPLTGPPVMPMMRSTMPKSSTTSSSPANHIGSSLLTPGVEHQGESSLSAQATFANRFLEDAVINKSVGTSIAIEMTSALESLRKALGRNSGQQDHDYLYPHARPLERGLNLRNLPMPPVEVAFRYQGSPRSAENPRVRFFWNHEANSVSSFHEYFLKVYSPGEASHTDLIVVNAGLYWLFRECKKATANPDEKRDFGEQAIICRDNLETVLANLPFHQPSTPEATFAMMIASIYCLEICKPSAAWNFIATASHMCQTLGIHSIVSMSQINPETRLQQTRVFWLIYIYEKGLSLRLGRSSTLRDSDITIPVPDMSPTSEIAYFGRLKKMVDLARLQGKIYDQLYSPAALVEPQISRTTRARSLASELKAHTTSIEDYEISFLDAMRQAIGSGSLEAFECTAKVVHLSLFCLIYRAIPAEPNQGTIFGQECIDSARRALEAHKESMSVVARLEEDVLESYVNWALLLSPFVPFIVIFCHSIETCNKSDLELLNSIIETLQAASTDLFSSGAKRELHLFKALHDAAYKYHEAKNSKADVRFGAWATPASLIPSPADQQAAATTPTSNFASQTNTIGRPFGEASGWNPECFGPSGAFNTEVDQYGAQLGNWLHMNSQMTKALEDSYFWEDLL
ncbi:fungal specific transcription factor [Fusarium flagelliforme]|uniref:Fungal specific transcription factor n=1 Tax=Fusarium flagelliforme TaxID=2675880 RepID=A0A395MIG7_9HYPO|nr:fungal specific transcription factor [Fusarium flagelliforme]